MKSVYNNMDGSGGHIAVWNKSGRERQRLFDTTYLWNLKNKQVSAQRRRTDGWLPEVGVRVGEMGEGRQEVQPPSYKINPGRTTYSRVITVANTALHIWKFAEGVDIEKFSSHTKVFPSQEEISL